MTRNTIIVTYQGPDTRGYKAALQGFIYGIIIRLWYASKGVAELYGLDMAVRDFYEAFEEFTWPPYRL